MERIPHSANGLQPEEATPQAVCGQVGSVVVTRSAVSLFGSGASKLDKLL